MKIEWFAPEWNSNIMHWAFAPICRADNWVSTPVGATCKLCQREFTLTDQGIHLRSEDKQTPSIAYHIACFRFLIGLKP